MCAAAPTALCTQEAGTWPALFGGTAENLRWYVFVFSLHCLLLLIHHNRDMGYGYIIQCLTGQSLTQWFAFSPHTSVSSLSSLLASGVASLGSVPLAFLE